MTRYWRLEGLAHEKNQRQREKIVDMYTKAFVMSMGVRVPTKHALARRFCDYVEQNHDGLLEKTEEEIYELIPSFIEHLGEI